MADTQTAEAKELALVGKVEMRIALASSEKKLEDLLKIYLAPLLLKLGSEYVAVRNKVGSKPFLKLLKIMSSFCIGRR
jgi:proteasome component ECM29